jgi:hypothetical protein
MRRRIANALYQRLGYYRWKRRGSDMPDVPVQGLTLRFGEIDDGLEPPGPMLVAEANNDGFELWVGYMDKWLFHCRSRDARKLAWWILLRWWALGEWFGLRRALWYWALNVRVDVLKPSPSGPEEVE